MSRIVALAGLLAALSPFSFTANAQSPALRPLVHAHSHNDYEHARPLLDALDQGFCSVEADIYLVNGTLLVAHDRDQVQTGRTLEALYLEPLQARVQANGGRVYKGGPSVVLLVDVKSEAEPTYQALVQALRPFEPMLTRFSPAGIETNAVTVIVSGNRAPGIIAQETQRYAALDGRPEDLGTSAPAALIPLISENWAKLFSWRGNGPVPDSDQKRLRELVSRAHNEGRRVRFWGTPDRVSVWEVLRANEVDLINADDLAALAKWLRTHSRPEP